MEIPSLNNLAHKEIIKQPSANNCNFLQDLEFPDKKNLSFELSSICAKKYVSQKSQLIPLIDNESIEILSGDIINKKKNILSSYRLVLMPINKSNYPLQINSLLTHENKKYPYIPLWLEGRISLDNEKYIDTVCFKDKTAEFYFEQEALSREEAINNIITNPSVSNHALLITSDLHKNKTIKKLEFKQYTSRNGQPFHYFEITKNYNINENLPQFELTGGMVWNPKETNLVAIACKINNEKKQSIIIYDLNTEKYELINLELCDDDIYALTYIHQAPNCLIAYTQNKNVMVINTKLKIVTKIGQLIQAPDCIHPTGCISLFNDPKNEKMKQKNDNENFTLIINHSSNQKYGFQYDENQTCINFSLKPFSPHKVTFKDRLISMFYATKNWFKQAPICTPQAFLLGAITSYLAWKYFKK